MSQDAEREELAELLNKPRTINDLPEDWQFLLRRKLKKGMVASLPDGSIWKTDHMMRWRQLSPPIGLKPFKPFELGHMYRKTAFTRAEVREMAKQDQENGSGRNQSGSSDGVGRDGVGKAAPNPAHHSF